MATWTIVLIVILVILVAAVIIMYVLGKRAEKKQAEQEETIKQYQQQVSMLIIDKKRIRAKDADLPESMLSEIPWYLKRSKIPVVKAKVGPQIMNFVSDESIFDDIPVKKEVKATISGLYITNVRGIRKTAKPEEKKKKGFFSRFRKK